jgi:hypothetical protein
MNITPNWSTPYQASLAPPELAATRVSWVVELSAGVPNVFKDGSVAERAIEGLSVSSLPGKLIGATRVRVLPLVSVLRGERHSTKETCRGSMCLTRHGP